MLRNRQQWVGDSVRFHIYRAMIESAMAAKGGRELIQDVVTSWEGVSVYPHRYGGIEFRLGKRELGHLHGDRLLDIPFPRQVRDELVDAGRVQKHHILPASGWVSFVINTTSDVGEAVSLLRRSFELAVAQKSRREWHAKNAELLSK